MPNPAPKPGNALLSSIYILSLAIMIFNDHYWKGVGPSWLTGKLSDVVILIMGPLTIQAFVELTLSRFTRNWGPSRTLLILLSLAMSAIMIAINLWVNARLCVLGMITSRWCCPHSWQTKTSI